MQTPWGPNPSWILGFRSAEGGVHDLCLRFTGDDGRHLNLDHYRFE
jgi:hypothetical protein